MRKVLSLALLLFISCEAGELPVSPKEEEIEDPVEQPAAGVYYLPLIETTDIHGHIVESDNTADHYRMAYVANKVKKLRTVYEEYDKDRLLLLDAGDLYQGASISNLLSGKPVYTSVDLMDYDAVALGNHEFDWGIENLIDPDATLPDYEWNGRTVENLVPVVCANFYQDGSRASCTKDYVVVEKKARNSEGEYVNVKIGIIGFAVNYATSIMASKFSEKGYSIRENYSIANSIASELEDSGECDATVLLIHGAADGAASSLGKDSVIDLVLGGHSHRYFYGDTDWGLPYLQGGRYCERFAYASLIFNVDGEGNVSFSSVENRQVVEVDAARDQNPDYLDKDVLSVSDEALSAIGEQMNDVVGYITISATKYSINGSGGRASLMGNWMCDILRSIGNAEVAFVNSGGIRTDFQLNGEPRRYITVADVYSMFPFSNTVYVYSITYEELLSILEYSLGGGSGLFSRMTGIDCYYNSENKVRKLVKEDGTVIYEDSAWVDDWDTRAVTLAVSEYLATSESEDYYTGMVNPLPGWNNTSRLLDNELIDNENAVSVLRAEAASTGGLLWIDKTSHYILSQ